MFLAILLVASVAQAQRCGDDATAWVARCAQATSVPMELEACPPSVAIVSTKEVRVEISASFSASSKAFARVGAYGLSPIGDFPDWALEPEARRHAFDAVVQCVSRDPPMRLLSNDAPGAGPFEASRPRVPWLLLAGVVTALLACVRCTRATALAVLAVLGAFLLRRWLQPFAFFHQNGQGPLWIEFAYRGDAGDYGPGFAEIFGLVSHARRPDQGVAWLQEALAATVPLSGYAIARSVRAHRFTACAVFAGLALDPVLLRVSRSESYFSVIEALLFAATAVLASTDVGRLRGCLPLHRRAPIRRVLGAIAAALLLAQAARVHPLAWVPCALVPLVLFSRPGRALHRARRVAIAAAVIAVVAAPFVVAPMRAALSGELGAGFLPGARALVAARGALVAFALVAVSSLAIARPTRALAGRALVLAIVVAVAALSDVLKSDAEVVRAAHLHLALPVGLAASVAMARFRAAYVVVGALALLHVAMERRLLVLPTDARELDWALQWREQLPPGATVASLGRVRDRLLALPLLGDALPAWRRLDEEGRAADASYYYRSSLCSTPEGAPSCARFEGEHRLRRLASRRFPSIASLPWQPLPLGEIEVVLFAVE